MNNQHTRPSKRTFYWLWSTQSLSLLGTGMTRFAVLIWAYDLAGTASAIALLGFFSCITYVITSPISGVLVDRWDRRKVLIASDFSSGLMTAALLALLLTGRLELWHLYLMEGLTGIFEAFQDPAFYASVSLLVPREEYTRSNGLLGLGRSATRVLAPAAAGLVQQAAGLGAVMMVDIATMSIALAVTTLIIRIPSPPASEQGQLAAGSFWKEMRFGLGYILRSPGLRTMLLTFFLINLFATLTYFAVHSPMILARTGGDEVALGIVRSMMGAGGIAGGLLLTLRSSFRRKARVYLTATAASFLVGDFMTAISRTTAGWAAAGFLSELAIPFIVSPYFALWQEWVPPDVQGRVFSSRDMVQVAAQPVGYLMGGLLADRLFEPAMAAGGTLAGPLGWLVGTGPGSGMAVMFLCTSLLGLLTGIYGLLSPALRQMDQETPPFYQTAAA